MISAKRLLLGQRESVCLSVHVESHLMIIQVPKKNDSGNPKQKEPPTPVFMHKEAATLDAFTTYVEALSRKLPASHLSTLMQTRVKERQVLIDKDPATATNHLAKITKHELV